MPNYLESMDYDDSVCSECSAELNDNKGIYAFYGYCSVDCANLFCKRQMETIRASKTRDEAERQITTFLSYCPNLLTLKTVFDINWLNELLPANRLLTSDLIALMQKYPKVKEVLTARFIGRFESSFIYRTCERQIKDAEKVVYDACQQAGVKTKPDEIILAWYGMKRAEFEQKFTG